MFSKLCVKEYIFIYFFPALIFKEIFEINFFDRLFQVKKKLLLFFKNFWIFFGFVFSKLLFQNILAYGLISRFQYYSSLICKLPTNWTLFLQIKFLNHLESLCILTFNMLLRDKSLRKKTFQAFLFVFTHMPQNLRYKNDTKIDCLFVWLFFKVSYLIKKYHFEYVDFIIFYFWQWHFQLNSIQYIFRNIYKLDILLSSLLVFCYLEFFSFLSDSNLLFWNNHRESWLKAKKSE